MDLTILELNLEGAEFTANAPGIGEHTDDTGGGLFGRSDGDDTVSEEATDDGRRGPRPLVAILALVIVVIAVALVRRLTGDDE